MPKIDYSELNGMALLLQQARLEILANCGHYEQNLHEFSSDTDLSGKSWSNAKKHAENVAPVVKALANALSQTGEVFSNYLSSFQSEVGSPKNRLDTDKLQELNDRLKQTRASKKAVLQQIEKLKDFPSNQIMGSSGSDYAILAFDSAMGTMHRDIEILEKYRSFETAHAQDFAEVLHAFEAIQSGLKAINAGDTFSSGSGYKTKNMQKAAWMTSLTAYNNKQPKTHTEYVKRYRTVTDENGITKTFVVYDTYTNGEYDFFKSQQVAELMQEAQMEKGKEFLLEITSVNDFIRTFKGVDPITGEKLSSQERGFAALMVFLTAVSAGTALKILKNARRGATLMKDVDVAGEVSRIESKVGGVEKTSGAVDDILTDGSHLLDGKLKPNSKYVTGEFDYRYETDVLGRVNNFQADDLKLTSRTDRLKHNPNTPGKLEGDHAGHLAGDRFGGSPEIDNLISQSSKVNQSAYKKIENQWARAISEGKQVSVDVNVNYDSAGLRPKSFDIDYTIDGKWYSKHIEN